MVALAKQKKRKRTEFEHVLPGNVSMKLEVARSKAALNDQIADCITGGCSALVT